MKLKEHLIVIQEALAILLQDKIDNYCNMIINDPLRASVWGDKMSRCLNVQNRLLKESTLR
jgi:hypothetical protein